MPAARLSRRRKSSHALFTPAKPGIYGIPARPVTFAPNVTPVTYVDTDDLASDLALDGEGGGSPTATLFPPSETPAPPPARKRCPPGKRRSQGYIPRPPNAFMLFRADFVRQKHVPGSIETNHGSLSKIIGTCWRQLPLEEKRVWEVRAKHEKAAHKAQFPDYRFRPVHNKNKHLNAATASVNAHSNTQTDAERRRDKPPATLEDERRCEEVAQLLLEGKKGEELAAAVRNLDRARERELQAHRQAAAAQSQSLHHHSHSSSSGPPSTTDTPSPRAPLLHMPLPVPGASPGMFGSSMGFGLGSFSFASGGNGGMHGFARRPSSVPLPGANEFYAAYGGGIAMPSLPFLPQHQQQGDRAPSPVASISRQGHHGFSGTTYHQPQPQAFSAYPFAPAPAEFAYTDDFTAGPSAAGDLAVPAGSNFRFSFSAAFPGGDAQNAFMPPSFSPAAYAAFASGHGHPTLAQRNSLGGLGRRASSAQPLLMGRSWDFAAEADAYSAPAPAHFGWTHAFQQQQQLHGHADAAVVERDHSPLPDVEPELFAPDFSFGGSSLSSAASSSSGSSASASAQAHSPPPVVPVDEAVSPVERGPHSPSPRMGVHAGVNPVDVAPAAHAHAHHSHSHSNSLDALYAPDAAAMWGAPKDALGMDMPLGMGMELGMEMDMGVHAMDLGMGYYDHAAGAY